MKTWTTCGKQQLNLKNKWFYVNIKFKVCIPYIRVLWNWMAHPKRMYNFECSCNKTKSMKCPCFSPLTPTYVMFPHLHILLHIHSRHHFPKLQYMPSCFWQNLYVHRGWSLFPLWNPCVASKHKVWYPCLSNQSIRWVHCPLEKKIDVPT